MQKAEYKRRNTKGRSVTFEKLRVSIRSGANVEFGPGVIALLSSAFCPLLIASAVGSIPDRLGPYHLIYDADDRPGARPRRCLIPH